MCRSCQVSLRVREKWKSHLASRGDRSLLMLTRSEPSVSVHFMMKDGCHVANQIAWRWRRFGACVQIGSAFAQTLERVKWKALQISSVHLIFFLKKSCIYFLLFRSCTAQTASASGKSSEDSKFSQSKNPTLFFFPFACIQLALRKACGRLAARNRENRCCMGRQSEGSTRKGVRRTGLRNSWPLFAARVHFAPSTSWCTSAVEQDERLDLHLRR